MHLPLGRANTAHSNTNSHSPRSRSYDSFENVHFLSPGAGPRPLHSPEGTSFPPNGPAPHLSSGLVLLDQTYQHSVGTTPNSSAMNTPLPSRSPSPLPPFYSSAPSSASDTDSDEPASPWHLDNYPPPPFSRGARPRWWQIPQRARHRPRRPVGWGYRYMMRISRRVFRHPFFPKHPSTIVRLVFPHVRFQTENVPNSFSLLFSLPSWRYQ
jgi:hypothetical protein